ncbi:MAG: M50 family metallopeptidase [Clostridia bacterium]|nr:M50 family metallopeptidase [Clostridia bacterium]
MRIRITPGAFLLVFVIALTHSALLPAFLFAAAIHECGHILAARVLGIRLRALELDLMGARLYPAAPLPSYRAEAVLAAAGPAASLLLALFLLPHGTPFARLSLTATAAFALFNLLPIAGFDGGRILSATLCARLGARAADRIQGACSYLTLLFLFALSSCCLLRYGQNLALAVLCASLFARTFLQQEK